MKIGGRLVRKSDLTTSIGTVIPAGETVGFIRVDENEWDEEVAFQASKGLRLERVDESLDDGGVVTGGDESFGVYPHAIWDDEKPRITNRGVVVRRTDGGVPYSRMEPLQTFAKEKAAQKAADVLNAQGAYTESLDDGAVIVNDTGDGVDGDGGVPAIIHPGEVVTPLDDIADVAEDAAAGEVAIIEAEAEAAVEIIEAQAEAAVTVAEAVAAAEAEIIEAEGQADAERIEAAADATEEISGDAIEVAEEEGDAAAAADVAEAQAETVAVAAEPDAAPDVDHWYFRKWGRRDA